MRIYSIFKGLQGLNIMGHKLFPLKFGCILIKVFIKMMIQIFRTCLFDTVINSIYVFSILKNYVSKIPFPAWNSNSLWLMLWDCDWKSKYFQSSISRYIKKNSNTSIPCCIQLISSLSSAVNLYFSEDEKILEARSNLLITAIYCDRKKFRIPFKMQSKLM